MIVGEQVERSSVERQGDLDGGFFGDSFDEDFAGCFVGGRRHVEKKSFLKGRVVCFKMEPWRACVDFYCMYFV